MTPAVPRPVLVAAGPVIGAATVVASLRATGSAPWFVTGLALLAAGGLGRSGHRGGDGALALGLGAVGVAVGASLVGDASVPAVALWAAGAVAAGEATGLARRARSRATPDAEVVAAEATWSAVVVVAALVGGLVLLGRRRAARARRPDRRGPGPRRRGRPRRPAGHHPDRPRRPPLPPHPHRPLEREV